MNGLRKLMGGPAEKRAARAPSGPPSLAGDESTRAAGEHTLGRALAARQRPAADDAVPVWVAAVCHANDKVQALEWSAALTDEPALAEIAAGSRFGEVRLAAAQRLADPSLLERVANASRDKDKRVYRHCSERLRERREAASRAQRLNELVRALRELLNDTPLAGSRLPALQQEWRALCKGHDDEGECASLLQQAQARSSDEIRSRHDVQAQRLEAETLRGEITAAQMPSMNKLETWAWRSGALEAALTRRPAWLVEHAEGRALRQALQEIEVVLGAHAEDMRRTIACERFIERLVADGPIDASAVVAWEALPKPAADAAQRELQSRWQALCVQEHTDAAAAPAAPIAPPENRVLTPAAPIDQAVVHALLADLEQHLEQGRLADAEKLNKQIERATHGTVPAGALGRRWRRARGQIARLRGWARWGTEQVREHLIADAEQLLRGEPEVDERARLVPALRREWKRLDAHGAASKSHWERFDAALTQAYQPVVEQRAEEAARHQAACAVKEALCSEWEAWLEGVAWDHTDFKVVEAQRQNMLRQWQAAATAGFREERGLRKRFDALLAYIEGKLSDVRQAERARREQLIAIVEGLRETFDLGLAISETKAVQARWRAEVASVRLSRAGEQALWQRFRGACDAVFARRDAQQAATVAQREQQAQARLERIRGFEASVQGADANALQQALGQFRNNWGDGRTARTADELENRARALVRQAEQRIAWLHNEKYRGHFELMAQKAALAQRLEAAGAAELPLEAIAAETRSAWSELAALPHKTEQLLAQRLAAAASVTPALLGAGHAARAAMLLDLEIVLGMPSPQVHAEARRTRQLAQLQQHFGATSADAQQPERLVAHWYATAATPDAEQEARMAAIVHRLSEAT